MKRLFALVLMMLPVFIYAFPEFAQTSRNLISPRRLTDIPEKISRRFTGSNDHPLQVYAIDLDQDRADDYIIIAYMNGQNTAGDPYCFFVENNMVLKYWQRISEDFTGWQNNWFLKLDDGMLYMIERSNLNGWSLYRFNRKIWDPKRVLIFNPVLENGNKKELLGLMNSWKVIDIRLKREGKAVRLRADFIPPSGEIAKKRNPGPFIYFIGEKEPDNIYEEQYFSIRELLKKSMK